MPVGTLSVETRLENRVGNPILKLVQGEGLPSIYYRPYYGHDTYGNYGGEYPPSYGFALITTPNPTSGFFLMVPRAETIELNMSVDAALKYVVSMGVVSPTDHGGAATTVAATRE